jgi:hypothetical protein
MIGKRRPNFGRRACLSQLQRVETVMSALIADGANPSQGAPIHQSYPTPGIVAVLFCGYLCVGLLHLSRLGLGARKIRVHECRNYRVFRRQLAHQFEPLRFQRSNEEVYAGGIATRPV